MIDVALLGTGGTLPLSAGVPVVASTSHTLLPPFR